MILKAASCTKDIGQKFDLRVASYMKWAICWEFDLDIADCIEKI